MSNEAVISGGLNALMLLQRGMEEMQKNPPAQQGPAGPTVAMQAQQAAQQAVSGQPPNQPPQDPSAPPPPGQPQPQENGIASIAQNVGTGAQIQAQQQQQAQQAMMAQAQQAQRPPQQMASGGIASLNTQNMRGFKEGGVLGFDGEDGSEVPKAKESPKPKFAFDYISKFLSEPADVPKSIQEQNIRQQILREASASGNEDLLNDPSAIAKEIQLRMPKPPAKETTSTEFPTTEDLLKYMRLNKDKQPKREPLPPEVIARQNQEALQTLRYQDPSRARLDTQAEYTPPVTPRPAGPAGPAAPKVPTSQSDLEGLIAAMAAGRASVPSTDISKQRALIDQIEAARAAQPNVGIEQLAAYRRAQDEYDAAAKERKESFGSRQFRELMRDMSLNRRGEGMARVGEEERKLTEADTTRRLTNAQLSGHIVDAQNARAVGDLEKKLTAENAITAILQKDAESKAKAGESIASAFGHIAQQRISANSSAANNETQMAIARMKAEQDKINNDILRQDKGFTGYQAAITNNENSRTRRLTEADTTFKDTSNKRLMMLENGSTEDKEKAAEIRAGHNTLLQGINDVFDQDRQKLLMLQWAKFGKEMGMPRPSDAVASTGGKTIKFSGIPNKG